ncbi:hypothetical protein IEQ34_019963 [Dendrobium chrysotoxum]|uniref:ABC transporter B family member 26, chloroplastic n=1 Tax=Dendrobium chrysotoxum TaxID=161865 RepID=A0AAV7GA07_DENCH|nr:hypothetical protein IEQ34_019963 [Dendrobium chrysotoxum]
MVAFLLPAAAIPPVIQTVDGISGSYRPYLFQKSSNKSQQIISHALAPPSPLLLLFRRRRRRRGLAPPSRVVYSHSSSNVDGFPTTRIPNQVTDSTIEGFRERLRAWRQFLPGGSWWLLQGKEYVEEGKGRWRKNVTVVQALKRMWFLVSGGRRVIFLAFASLFIASLSEIAIPHFLTASIFSAQSGKSMMFYRNAKILLSLCLVSGICSGLRSCCFGIANMILVKRMREVLYSTLLFQEMTLFDEETVGDLTSRLGSDCQQVSRVIGNDLNLICRNVVQGTGALIALFIISWPLALSMVLICASLATVLFFYGRYRTWLERLWDVSLRQSVGYGFWSLTYNYFYHSTKVVAVLIGGISILRGHTTAEQLTKFILYAEWLIYSAWWIGDNWSSLMQSIGARRQLQKLIGRIEFVDVSFHYPSRLMFPAVEHIHLSIQPNKVLAIPWAVLRLVVVEVGKAQLPIFFFAFMNQQMILVDGMPIEELDIKWLRGRIGFVGQEPPLFRMDVTSNIRYGCTRETTQEEVEWAAKQAFAHEFILSLPNGYSTLVDNALLSGGQKQRIAIARAILRDPTILILDEATSALDAESEHYIKELLLSDRNVSGEKRTVIVIAHRLSTIQAADTIVVMDDGRIVEVGNHKELLHKNGLYASLARRQSDAFIYESVHIAGREFIVQINLTNGYVKLCILFNYSENQRNQDEKYLYLFIFLFFTANKCYNYDLIKFSLKPLSYSFDIKIIYNIMENFYVFIEHFILFFTYGFLWAEVYMINIPSDNWIIKTTYFQNYSVLFFPSILNKMDYSLFSLSLIILNRLKGSNKIVTRLQCIEVGSNIIDLLVEDVIKIL